jgi:hypothetical protein
MAIVSVSKPCQWWSLFPLANHRHPRLWRAISLAASRTPLEDARVVAKSLSGGIGNPAANFFIVMLTCRAVGNLSGDSPMLHRERRDLGRVSLVVEAIRQSNSCTHLRPSRSQGLPKLLFSVSMCVRSSVRPTQVCQPNRDRMICVLWPACAVCVCWTCWWR